jgi:hypothetical protein
VTFIVQVGLTTGSGVSSTYLRLDDPVAGLLDVQVLAPDDVYTDLSTDSNGQQRVMAFDINRNSTQGAGMLVEYATGTLTLTLRDDHGDLDPANIAEPIPGIWINFARIFGGTVYSLFNGTIDSWLPEHRYPDQAVVVITASDRLASFAGYDRGAVTPTGAGATSGARINAVLDSVGWPAGAPEHRHGHGDGRGHRLLRQRARRDAQRRHRRGRRSVGDRRREDPIP